MKEEKEEAEDIDAYMDQTNKMINHHVSRQSNSPDSNKKKYKYPKIDQRHLDRMKRESNNDYIFGYRAHEKYIKTLASSIILDVGVSYEKF